jgi:hypothetical protein
MQLPVVPLERRLALPAFQVPNPGGGIARCRGEDAAVRRKCQAFYALSVTAQDLQTLADGQIPDSGREVFARRRQSPPIRGKRQVKDRFGMSVEHCPYFASLTVYEPNASASPSMNPVASDGKRSSVGRDSQGG